MNKWEQYWCLKATARFAHCSIFVMISGKWKLEFSNFLGAILLVISGIFVYKLNLKSEKGRKNNKNGDYKCRKIQNIYYWNGPKK